MFFEKKPKSQVERIKIKLKKVKNKDSNYNVFGSEKFEYELNDVISMKELEEAEKELGLKLPEAFRVFVTELGNGGAGPYYGVYSIQSIVETDKGNCSKNPCCIYPDMSKECWNEIVKHVDYADEDYVEIPDEEFDVFLSKLYGGLLKFGTQGCEYDMYLVVEGEYTGRIIYTNDPCKNYPFYFVYGDNFLDWYERWLDEILLDYDLTWFGNYMGGDEFYLLDLFDNSDDVEEKMEALIGFYKFKRISDSSCKKLEEIALENFDTNEWMTTSATSILAKFNFDKAKNLLHKLLNSDNEKYIEKATDIIIQKRSANIEDFRDDILKLLNSGNETYVSCAINILDKCKGIDIFGFKDGILSAFYNNKNESCSREMARLILGLGLNSYDVFGVWLKSDSKNLINNALPSLINVPYDECYFGDIKNLLLINDYEINENILNYLGVIEDERLLLYYKNLWNGISDINLERYTRYMKLFEDTLSKLNYPLDYFEGDRLIIELLEKFDINLQNKNIVKIINISCIKEIERVFVIYFLEDKSKCVGVYDYSGNFIFEVKIEDTKAVPMYFIYDFENMYVCALKDEEGISENLYELNLDEKKIINTKSWWRRNQYLSEREKNLIALTM